MKKIIKFFKNLKRDIKDYFTMRMINKVIAKVRKERRKNEEA